jgi:hypothetical protein
MGASDDPKHPLYPAFESPEAVPKKAWMVMYEGLSGAWLATSPFYVEEAARNMAASFDRGVKIVVLTVTGIDDVPMDERLKRRKAKKTTRTTEEPKTPKVRRVRKVKAPPPEVEPDDGVPEEPPKKKMKVRKVRKASQPALFDEEE